MARNKAAAKTTTDKVRYTKATLPSKVCVTCGRPFNWRKAWAKVWDDVKYCSERCRRGKTPTESR